MENMCCKGEVNVKFVINIQLDTGACRTVVVMLSCGYIVMWLYSD